MTSQTKNTSAGSGRACQNCKQDFIIEEDDFSFYEKIGVPAPTFCPDCRRQRRFAWRNYVTFYKATCGLSGASLVSLYPPELGMIVYSPKAWHSDKWNALEYGREYDFSKPFFTQYVDLLRRVPKPSMDTDDCLLSTNCMYTNDFAMGKNCYLTIKAWKLEDVMYSFYVVNSNNLVDVHTSFGKDEGNYETVNTEYCYQCKYVYDSRSCSDCTFCFDCRNCNNCFMSTGLRGKSYCYKNEEVGKEKYEQIIRDYQLSSYSGVERAKKEFEPLMQNHPRKALRMVNCKDSFGDLLFNCHDCKQCFLMLKSEHCKFDNYADGARDSYDTDAGGGSELVYESDLPAFSSNMVGAFSAWNCQDSSYVSHMYRSKNCFGCNGLKDARYCILNKQYSKEDYELLLPKIKQHMIDMPYVDARGRTYTYGDYLPIELSYFPYQTSEAQEIYPLSKDEIEKEHYLTQHEAAVMDSVGATLALDLPDDIADVDDSILTKTIISKSSSKRYKITEQELLFYRKYKIPLPRESFFERHSRRHKLAASFHIYEGQSDKSGEAMQSSYPSNRSEKVWTIDEYKAEFE